MQYEHNVVLELVKQGHPEPDAKVLFILTLTPGLTTLVWQNCPHVVPESLHVTLAVLCHQATESSVAVDWSWCSSYTSQGA